MSYFDHVRCHACRASLNPEEIGPQGMACPKCGAQLSLTDLFGVKASFAEDDLPDLGLDDLMGKVAQPGADYRPLPPPPKKPRVVAPGAAPASAGAQASTPRSTLGKGPIRPTVVQPAAPAPEPAPPPVARDAPRVRSIGLSSPGAVPPPAPSAPVPAAARALVPVGAASPPGEAPPPAPPTRRIPGTTSAADVMRALKKKR